MIELLRWTAGALLAGLALWLLVELLVRAFLARPLRVDFFGSIARDRVRERQQSVGVRAARGPGWVHLGWIADPERERYRVERRTGTSWTALAQTRFGSHLTEGEGGRFRVLALPRDGAPARSLGEAEAEPEPASPPLHVPRIAGPWRTLFRPERHGGYVNDHTVYRDAAERWRLLGITGPGEGDYARERWFAAAVSDALPPSNGMAEADPVADFGELAWAPAVLRSSDGFHLFWSPHRLHHMRSTDGVVWNHHEVAMAAPQHRFFRDAFVSEVAEGQWLLHATARGRYFSQIDLYQSFDLRSWQYIRTALRSGVGSERNSPFASMESPCLTRFAGRYYLTLTYNNDSFFWPGALLLFRIWPDRESYNDTRVFQSTNPYDFGTYRGARRTPSHLTALRAHAPKLLEHPETGAWFITTAGWPWVATLTSGEVAIAPLEWQPAAPDRTVAGC